MCAAARNKFMGYTMPDEAEGEAITGALLQSKLVPEFTTAIGVRYKPTFGAWIMATTFGHY